MTHEKIFSIGDFKEVKVTVRGYFSKYSIEIRTFIEVLVRDTKEAEFHVPPGLNLPKHGKVENMDERLMIKQIVSSTGISQDQFTQLMTEFKDIALSSVLW